MTKRAALNRAHRLAVRTDEDWYAIEVAPDVWRVRRRAPPTPYIVATPQGDLIAVPPFER